MIPLTPISPPADSPRAALRIHEVTRLLGSPKLVREMRLAGWLKPVVQRHRLTLFDATEVHRCWERLRAGETPDLATAAHPIAIG